MNIHVIIPAGGSGTRFGGTTKKQFLKLKNDSILNQTLAVFLQVSEIQKIVVCLPEQDLETQKQSLSHDKIDYVIGGATRSESVYKGFNQISNSTDQDVVLIHDAVRPFLTTALIENLIAETKIHGAVIPVMPVSDTIKESDDSGFVKTTLNRSQLCAVQTPQGFWYGNLKTAYETLDYSNSVFTDEAMLVEQAGVRVKMIAGEEQNKKITTQADFQMAQGQKKDFLNFKIGMGYDVHRLVEGRKCIIGGIDFEHNKGLLGHSDADVLLHAICDALLGAMNLGDLGELFPDNDPQFKGADSKKLLQICYQKVTEKGYRLNNLDTIIVCEKPKIKPRRDDMKNLIADILNVDISLISVKATTEEKMGFTGREEGIAAWAYVSLIQN